MELIILGSGTSVPHAKRASPAYWLQTATGSILLDASVDVLHRMAQEKLDWPNVDAIWISHFHLDHTGGLAPFLFGMKWAPQTLGRTKALTVYGGQGLTNLLRAIDDSNNYRLLAQRFPIEIIEITGGAKFEILPSISATTHSTPHTKESLALRLTEEGTRSFVYTSDTGFSDELTQFAAAADVLLLECSFRRNKPIATHLELAEAMEVAIRSSCDRVILTHLYPEWDDVDVVAEARQLWAGETIEATDGLRVQI